MSKDENLTFEDQIQELVDEMHIEAQAAGKIYQNRPNKENSVMPLAFGEAFGFSKAAQKYADKLQTLLVKSGPKGREAFLKNN